MKEAITRCQPSLVVCSMLCLGGMLAAEAARIPYVALHAKVYPLPARGLPPFGIGLRPGRGRLGRWRDEMLNRVIERLWDRSGLMGLNTLRRTYGLAPLGHMFDQLRRAHRQLVMTSRALDFPATLPAGVRYVGPVLDDPVWSQESSWIPFGDGKPLVLVSMSSTFQDQIGPLQSVIDALGTLPVHGIVTTGPALDAAALHAAPNVTVLARAPHREVLRHAAAVVTHGGHGTVVKALAAGADGVAAARAGPGGYSGPHNRTRRRHRTQADGSAQGDRSGADKGTAETQLSCLGATAWRVGAPGCR